MCAAGATQPLTVIVDRNAQGAGFDEVGPGSVDLLTGDHPLSATEASAFDPLRLPHGVLAHP